MAAKRELEVHGHRLKPGTDYSVHFAADVNVERVNGSAPLSDPVAEGTVSDDGSVKFKVEKRGLYVVAGPTGDKGKYAYTATAAK